MKNQRRTSKLHRTLAAFSLAFVLLVCAAPVLAAFRSACGNGCCRSKRTCPCAKETPAHSLLASHCSSTCGFTALAPAGALVLPVRDTLRVARSVSALPGGPAPLRVIAVIPFLLRQRPPPVHVS